MQSTIPRKLRSGDGLRVITPSRTIALPFIHPDLIEMATQRLAALGLKVTFGKYVHEKDDFSSSTVEHRLEDFHAALRDPSVHMLQTAIGGFNSNQLLRQIDYSLYRREKKILCGFSDITALTNAIYARTGVVTYFGPHFFSFGEKLNFEYTEDQFRRCLTRSDPYTVRHSTRWSDDRWASDQDNRSFLPSEYWVINPGQSEGKIIGGNLCTFNLLHGTDYMPDLDGTILLAEDDDTVEPHTFDRDLQSLLHQPGFKGVTGLIVGRFQKESGMTRDLLTKIVRTKPELKGLPIIANVDFGHTVPMTTLPIGGRGKLVAEPADPRLEVVEH